MGSSTHSNISRHVRKRRYRTAQDAGAWAMAPRTSVRFWSACDSAAFPLPLSKLSVHALAGALYFLRRAHRSFKTTIVCPCNALAMRIKEFLTCTLAAMLLAGCQSPSQRLAARATALEGTNWTLAELGGKRFGAIEGQRPPTLRLDPATHRVSGFSGVNTFGGSYMLNGAALKFTPLMGTRMAGPPEAMATETRYLTALSTVSAWRIAASTLELLAVEEVVARFHPSALIPGSVP
jgi:heat shock protein HslJ